MHNCTHLGDRQLALGPLCKQLRSTKPAPSSGLCRQQTTMLPNAPGKLTARPFRKLQRAQPPTHTHRHARFARKRTPPANHASPKASKHTWEIDSSPLPRFAKSSAAFLKVSSGLSGCSRACCVKGDCVFDLCAYICWNRSALLVTHIRGARLRVTAMDSGGLISPPHSQSRPSRGHRRSGQTPGYNCV